MSSRPISLIALGVTLFLAALAASWVQDVAAPWLNLGEAQMATPITFAADGGTYRIISSGTTRPSIAQTGCTIVLAGGTTKRALGGTGGVNAHERLGVSRVLEFTATRGKTQVTCADRIVRGATHGRYQVVAADGPVSKGIIAGFVFGVLSLLAGGIWLVVQYRRAGPAGPAALGV